MPSIHDIIINGWKPAVEILILAVGIYYAFNFVRATRGAPVVYGFLVLLLSLTVIAYFLKLEVLGWLLRWFVGFAAVAILIIFQPEIRRMLAELGTHPVFNANQEKREIIEVICETVERLADVRIGALVAIEQSIPLTEATESGVPIDCQATPEMLETIFFPNNAIHDGGVIIRGDRIISAARIFPLTQRTDLHPSLGTRHRAAIGLTEETDALVIVVSEETGSVSHCYKGHLVRGVTVEALRAFLTSVLVKRSKPHNAMTWVRSLSEPRTQHQHTPHVQPAVKLEPK
jgi:diadenylate cyclase